ncbi:hypothetical protein RZS08_53115, partial [Arthrospira platensis SPKY1]|nr:hypothetical protein [Arthrospira platensis SPKY1]
MSGTILRQNVITQFLADTTDLKAKVKEAEGEVNRYGLNVKKVLGAGALLGAGAVIQAEIRQ